MAPNDSTKPDFEHPDIARARLLRRARDYFESASDAESVRLVRDLHDGFCDLLQLSGYIAKDALQFHVAQEALEDFDGAILGFDMNTLGQTGMRLLAARDKFATALGAPRVEEMRAQAGTCGFYSVIAGNFCQLAGGHAGDHNYEKK